MKKYIILCCAGMALSASLHAQKSAVANAAIYHSEDQIANAAKEIDKAVAHEKTIADPKAWYYRGLIYKSMIGSKDENVKALSEHPERESLLSFRKAMELDASGKFTKQSTREMRELFPEFINKGYGMYSVSDFQQALEYFEAAQMVRPEDTTGYLYATYAAEELERFDLVGLYIEKLESIGYKSPRLYLQKIASAQKKEVSPRNALEISKRALLEYPDHKDLLAVQTSLFIESGLWNEAIANLNTLHKSLPDNQDYLRVLASVYDQSGDRENALATYEKLLSLDPSNGPALYGTGAIYYEKASKIFEELQGLSKTAFKANGGEDKEATMRKLFGEAKSRAVKAMEVATEDEEQSNISHLLTQIDRLLNAYDNYKKQLR